MKIEYDKKDITSPLKQNLLENKKPDFPEGWQYYVKRGSHCTLDPNGNQVKHASKEAAMEYANG